MWEIGGVFPHLHFFFLILFSFPTLQRNLHTFPYGQKGKKIAVPESFFSPFTFSLFPLLNFFDQDILKKLCYPYFCLLSPPAFVCQEGGGDAQLWDTKIHSNKHVGRRRESFDEEASSTN